jgi:hypothetical protein
MCVAIGGLDLKYPFADLKDRDIECTASKVVDNDLLFRLLIESIGEA